MSSYFGLPQTFSLNHLEKLIYSEDRLATYNELYPHNGNRAEGHFMKTFLAQLDLEKSFSRDVHTKYKVYHKYLTEFETYARGHISAYSNMPLPFRQLHFQHNLTNLQTILVSLGASDEDIRSLHIFHEQSVDNIHSLLMYYQTLEKTNNIELKSTENIICPTNDELRTKFFSKLISMMNFYYSQSPPEASTSSTSTANTDPNSSNYNTFSHLLEKIVSAQLTTSLPAFNPFTIIMDQYDKYFNPQHIDGKKKIESDEKYVKNTGSLPTETSDFLSSVIHSASIPFVLTLIESGKIDYEQLRFFPTLAWIVKGLPDTGISIAQQSTYIDLVAFYLYQSKIITDELQKIRDKYYKSDDLQSKLKDSPYYPYSSFTSSFEGINNVAQFFTYEDLLQLQQKMASLDKSIAQSLLCGSVKYIEILILKFIPPNFAQLRLNNNVGVNNPYTSTEQIDKHNNVTYYPTRNRLDTPIIIMNESDLKQSSLALPSFLLTTMNIYQQVFDVLLASIKNTSSAAATATKSIFSLVSSSGSDTPATKTFYSFYYSLIAHFLHYTSTYNVWRFDIFTSIFLPSQIYNTISIEYKTTSSPSNYSTGKYRYSDITNSGALSPVFPRAHGFNGFENLIRRYIEAYYSLPSVTDHKYKPFSSIIDNDELSRLFYNIKYDHSLHSKVIIDVVCDQKIVLDSKDIVISSLENIGIELANAKKHVAAEQPVNISVFDPSSLYPNETAIIQTDLANIISKQGKNNVPRVNLQFHSTPQLQFINQNESYKNAHCIDDNGNIRTTLTLRNVPHLIVNVYHIDIMTYYKSILSKSANAQLSQSQLDIDPNIDLEGLVPHWTSNIDLSGVIEQNQIKPHHMIDMNLCIDSLPQYGVFMVEILRGTDALRFCVRKGTLNVIKKQINKGSLLLLINDQGELVKFPRVYIGNDVFKPLNADKQASADVAAFKKQCIESIPVAQSITEQELSSYFIHIPSYTSPKTLLLTDASELYASCTVLELHSISFSMSCDWFTSVESFATNAASSSAQSLAKASKEAKEGSTNIEAGSVLVNSTELVNLTTGAPQKIGGGSVGAEVLIKPVISRAGKVIDINTVNVVKSTLNVTAKLQTDVTITDTVDNFELIPKREAGVIIPTQEILHAFNVPQNLSSLSFTLDVTVEFEGKEYELSSSFSQTIASIQKTALSSGMILCRRINGIYFAYTVDKAGRMLPYVELRCQLTSPLYTHNVVNQAKYITLHTDINGCVELGPLFGISHFSLTTPTTQYSFIRGTFSFNVHANSNSDLYTAWPSELNVIVDDDKIDKVPSNTQGIKPQVTLAFPSSIIFNPMLFNLFKKYTDVAVKNHSFADYVSKFNVSSKHLKDVSNPDWLEQPTDIEVANIIDYFVKYGYISLTESTPQTAVRQSCTQLMKLSPTSVNVYGLKPYRTYVLSYSFPPLGHNFSTEIKTYRNPRQDAGFKKQLQFGSILPQQYYFDNALNTFFDYLICKNKVLQIKQSLSKQLTLGDYSYDPQNQILSVQLNNYNPDTTKLLFFASSLITTPQSLKNLFIRTHQHQLSNIEKNTTNDPSNNGFNVKSEAISFVNGVSTSGEREYVTFRRELIKSMKQIGCMLPQPTLLLNKRLRRHTDPIQDEEKEKAKKGSVEVQASPAVAEFAKSKRKAVHNGPTSSMAFGDARQLPRPSTNGIFPLVQFDEEYYILDILKNKSTILCNIQPDANGLVTLKYPELGKYSTLTVIAYETKQVTSSSNFGCNVFTVDIPQDYKTMRLPFVDAINPAEPNTTLTTQQQHFIADSSFKLTLNPKYQYTEDHRTGIIAPVPPQSVSTSVSSSSSFTPLTIVGPSSTVELEVISSRSDLYALLMSLSQVTKDGGEKLLPSRAHQGNFHEVYTVMSKFKFLHSEWLNDFTDAQKLTHLDRHACHELHLFIFFNDRTFFEKFLRLHLANKMAKDIVDLWLLSQALTLVNSADFDAATIDLLNGVKYESRLILAGHRASLAKLNVLEQILLLSVVDPVALSSIAKQMGNDTTANCSLHRNNLAWVTIFESCLRRTMLSLNTVLQEAEQGLEETNEDMVYSDESSDDNSDGISISTNENAIMRDQDEGGYHRNLKDEESFKMQSKNISGFSLANSLRGRGGLQPQAAPIQAQFQQSTTASTPLSSQLTSTRSRAPPIGMAMKCAAAPMALGGKLDMHSDMLMMTNSIDAIADQFEADNNLKSMPSYKPLDKTGEYEERTWYIDAKNDGQAGFRLNTLKLVQWSSFWVDFASYMANPTLFSIDNDQSDETKYNTAFASNNVLDLIDASATEYLLCLAVSVLSPTQQSKQLILTNIPGTTIAQSMDTYKTFTTSSNSASPLTNAPNFVIQPKVNYKVIKQVNTTYPIIALHKQTQRLSSKASVDSGVGGKQQTPANSLTAAQYYIDIFETIQKKKHIYVTPDQMFKKRAYLCKTVISNMSNDEIKVKVLITLPDNTLSIKYDDPHSNSGNITQIAHNLTTKTVYTTVRAYSSSIIQYSFLLGEADQYTHYGAVISAPSAATKASSPQLYCFVPSTTLQCQKYKLLENKRDVITIARESSAIELCEFLSNYYYASDNNVDEDEEPRQEFKLDYINFRFNQHYNKDQTLQQRFDLWSRVYTIAKGYITIQQNLKTSSAWTFVTYALHFLEQIYATKALQTFKISPEQMSCLVHALSLLYKQYMGSLFNMKSWQHLEYLPLIAARIHNSSIRTDNDKAASAKDIFIPDQQLKDQYIETLKYVICHSSNVNNVPYVQLLSLLYYAIILNQSVRVISLLKSLLMSLSNTTANSTKRVDISATVRIQLAYMLIFIDISNYGSLQTTLTERELDLLANIFNNDKISNINSTPQTTYGLALILSQQFQSYPIKQWKLLFLQSYQYLEEGQVIVKEITSQPEPTKPLITDDDFDTNVAGQSVHQQALRQDSQSSLTPSLSCTIQHTLTTTDVSISYANLSPAETSLALNVYYIDSELLLSHKPFMHSSTVSAANTPSSSNNDQITKSHLTIHVPLPKNNGGLVNQITVALPAHIAKESSLTITAPKTHISTSSPLLHAAFIVQTLTKQGIVCVLDAKTHQPVPGCYVKCYSEGINGNPATFHHDNYTDLRGKSDFMSSSNSQKKADGQSAGTQRVALIIAHPELGVQVVYADKPQV